MGFYHRLEKGEGVKRVMEECSVGEVTYKSMHLKLFQMMPRCLTMDFHKEATGHRGEQNEKMFLFEGYNEENNY